jgi:hypothetical protein
VRRELSQQDAAYLWADTQILTHPDLWVGRTDHELDCVLHRWIRIRFGWDIPRVAVCPHHVAPFRLVSDLFFERASHVVAFASRFSGKTLDVGILFAALLELICGIEIAHVGAQIFQSAKCFEYVDEMIGDTPMSGRSKPMSGKGKFHLANGSKISILTASAAGCQAEHPQLAGFDEIRHSSSAVLEEWKNMAGSSEDRQGQSIITSSRANVGDLMDVVLERADAEHRKVYAWCVWEVAERCDRRSCAECERYVSYDRMGKPHTFAEVCGGKMRESRGFMPWRDIVDRFVGLVYSSWIAQQECLRPEQVGAYYSHFQREIHCIGADSTKWRPNNRGCIVALDFGVADPNAMAIGQPAGPPSDPWRTVVWVDSFEDGDGDTIIESWPAMAKLAAQYGPILECWGDPAGKARQQIKGGHSAIRQLKNTYGIHCRTSPRFNSYIRRHDAVENRLRRRSDGEPAYYFWTDTPGGKRLARCIEALRRPTNKDGVPIGEEFYHDEHSHLCTCVEFGTVGLYVVKQISC